MHWASAWHWTKNNFHVYFTFVWFLPEQADVLTWNNLSISQTPNVPPHTPPFIHTSTPLSSHSVSVSNWVNCYQCKPAVIEKKRQHVRVCVCGSVCVCPSTCDSPIKPIKFSLWWNMPWAAGSSWHDMERTDLSPTRYVTLSTEEV